MTRSLAVPPVRWSIPWRTIPRPTVATLRALGPVAVAVAVVAFGHAAGWRGVDTAAQVYRVESYQSNGFLLWDFSWYGGHWTLDYSVLYPVLAGTFGILLMTVLSAAAATLGFDRLARPHLGPAGEVAAYVFAVGTLVAASIGQLTFLAGEAFGLPAVWAMARGRRVPAVLLALGCTLTSPLTGAFLALAATAWALDRAWHRDRRMVTAAAVAAAAGLPILVAAVVFPGDGAMPYPAIDWVWEMGVAAGVAVFAGRRRAPLAIGAVLYMVAASVSEAVPSSLGGNIGRLEDLVALPVGVALAWDRLPVFLPFAAVPLFLSQWVPAWGAFTTAPSQPSTHEAFFTPLDDELQKLAGSGPAGRVEVIPTAYHWEAAFVAPIMPLARGWERQLDEADNPIFYQPGRLDPGTYRTWLLDNGVRFVALAAAPLDTAGRAEGALVASGRVPGLHLAWQSADWKLYEVDGSPGIVSGPAALVSTEGNRVVLDALSPGPVTIRIRWSPDWYVAEGAGCVERNQDWMSVDIVRTGVVSLQMSLFEPDRTACPTTVVAAGASGS